MCECGFFLHSSNNAPNKKCYFHSRVNLCHLPAPQVSLFLEKYYFFNYFNSLFVQKYNKNAISIKTTFNPKMERQKNCRHHFYNLHKVSVNVRLKIRGFVFHFSSFQTFSFLDFMHFYFFFILVVVVD